MIEFVEIQNFQNHDRLRIEFDPSMTTIIGPSDVGKSAALRAVKWVCTNTPSGDSFIQKGKTFTEVVLGVDGHRVRRKKGRDGENAYFLDEKEFRAFGLGVPDEIRDLLNLQGINFVGQHDPSFWFSLSPGEVSKQLNSIVDLNIIDTAFAKVAAKINKCQTQLSTSKDRLTETSKKRASLEWVEACDKDLKYIEALEPAYLKMKEKKATLQALITTGDLAQQAHKSATDFKDGAIKVGMLGIGCLRVSKKIELLTSLIESAETFKAKAEPSGVDLTHLEKLKDSVLKVQSRVSHLSTAIQRYNENSKATKYPDASNLEALVVKIQGVTERRKTLKIQVLSVQSNLDRVDYEKKVYSKIMDELKSLTGGICPVCESPMKELQ